MEMFFWDEKGQMVSNDFFIGIIIFLFVISLFLFSSNLIYIQTGQFREFEDLKQASIPAMNSLIYSPGDPGNWEEFDDLNGVSSIGLVSSRNELVQSKMDAIVDLNALHYSKIKELLGVQKYDLQVEIWQLQNNQELAVFGISPDQNSTVASSTAIVNLGGDKVKVIVKVFDREE